MSSQTINDGLFISSHCSANNSILNHNIKKKTCVNKEKMREQKKKRKKNSFKLQICLFPRRVTNVTVLRIRSIRCILYRFSDEPVT